MKGEALKICDLGSSKLLTHGGGDSGTTATTSTSTPHVCTRMYRAPELLFGATQYTTQVMGRQPVVIVGISQPVVCVHQVDMWSAGCGTFWNWLAGWHPLISTSLAVMAEILFGLPLFPSNTTSDAGQICHVFNAIGSPR